MSKPAPTTRMILLCAALGASGCTASRNDVGLSVEEHADTEGAAHQERRLDQLIRPSLVKVTASGSGCPAGTYDANLSRDGKVATVRFAGFQAEGAAAGIQSRNCTISLTVSAPPDLAVAVSSLRLSGYAYLEPDVTAEQSAYYTFAGGFGSLQDSDGFGIPEHRQTLTGPYDDSFVFQDSVEPSRLIFSECGKPATVLLNTRLVLRNRGRGYGFVSIRKADSIAFATRRCDTDNPDAGRQDGGPDTLPIDAGVPDGQVSPITPMPGAVITSATAIGPLCPIGTTSSVISSDGRDVSLKFNHTMSIDENASFNLGTCNVVLTIDAPAGQAVTLDGFDARGSVSMQDGMELKIGSSYWFSLPNDSQSARREVIVNESGAFMFDGEFSSAEKFSACGGPARLNVRLDATLTNSSSPSSGSVQLTEFGRLKLRLRSCSK